MNSGFLLQRYESTLGPQQLGEMFTLTREGVTLRCALATHHLGWTLRLIGGSNFFRSQVCRTQDEVFDVAEAWKAEARAQGWN
jgi:hypothetical protein